MKKVNIWNDKDIPVEFMLSLARDDYQVGEIPSYASVTGLQNSPKVFWGMKTVYKELAAAGKSIPASTRVYILKGQMTHQYQEDVLREVTFKDLADVMGLNYPTMVMKMKQLGLGDDINQLSYRVENTIYYTVKLSGKEYIVKGTFDVYSLLEEALRDYKNMSVPKYNRALGLSKFGTPAGFEEYEIQQNVYSFILNNKCRKIEAECKVSGADPRSYDIYMPVKQIQLIIDLRDWSVAGKIQQPSLPKTAFSYYNIPLWKPEKTQAWIEERIRALAVWEGIPLDKIPECSPEDRWERVGAFKVFKYDNMKKKITGKKAEPGSAKLKTKEDAQQFIDNKIGGAGLISNEDRGYTIVETKSDPTKCISWCTLSQLGKCNWWEKQKHLYIK